MPLDIDHGRALLAELREWLADDRPFRDKPAWDSWDINELFDCWGFEKEWLFDQQFNRYPKDSPGISFIVGPYEKFGSDMLKQVVNTFEQWIREANLGG